jgi:hypothetical protein
MLGRIWRLDLVNFLIFATPIASRTTISRPRPRELKEK